MLADVIIDFLSGLYFLFHLIDASDVDRCALLFMGFIIVEEDLNIFSLFQCVFVSAMPKTSILFLTMLADISLIFSLLFANIPFAFMKPILVDAMSFYWKCSPNGCDWLWEVDFIIFSWYILLFW